MAVHPLIVQLHPEQLRVVGGVWRTFVFLYVGPDQILPLTSALGAIAGVLMIFWQRTVAFLRKSFRFLASKLFRSKEP